MSFRIINSSHNLAIKIANYGRQSKYLSITDLISAFRQITAQDSITPESLGYILQRIADLVVTVKTSESKRVIKHPDAQARRFMTRLQSEVKSSFTGTMLFYQFRA